ncbi:MAG: hypothetical protein GX359_09385 [Clostridiales bacterium]|nr:hypothetical protein [Clostridiales bacterium]
MQLLVLVLKKVELMDQLIKALAENGVTGGTILNGSGMAKALVNMEDLPIFGMLRQLLSEEEEKESCKVMMFVLKNKQAIETRKVIKDVIGDLKEPNTGIMFAVPISYVEGF